MCFLVFSLNFKCNRRQNKCRLFFYSFPRLIWIEKYRYGCRRIFYWIHFKSLEKNIKRSEIRNKWFVYGKCICLFFCSLAVQICKYVPVQGMLRIPKVTFKSMFSKRCAFKALYQVFINVLNLKCIHKWSFASERILIYLNSNIYPVER